MPLSGGIGNCVYAISVGNACSIFIAILTAFLKVQTLMIVIFLFPVRGNSVGVMQTDAEGIQTI